MKTNEDDRIQHLLKQALPPVDAATGPERDLWPALLRRLDSQPAPHAGWVWFDGALLAGLVAFAALYPASIPVFLFYL